MVSTGDTEISLHTRVPWKFGGGAPDQLNNPNPKCQDLSKSAFSRREGGGLDQHSWNTWVGALKEFWTQILPAKFW